MKTLKCEHLYACKGAGLGSLLGYIITLFLVSIGRATSMYKVSLLKIIAWSLCKVTRGELYLNKLLLYISK